MTPEKTTPKPELTAFSIANSPKPTISAEGQAAKDRIAAAKEARNNTTITSGDLQSQPQFNLTPPAPAVQADGLQAAIGQEAQDSFVKAQQDATSQAQTQSKSAKDSFLDAEMKRIGFTGFQSQLENTPEFTATQNELQDINQQIREEDLALRRATERIISQGGQSKGQAQSQINNLTRDSLSRQADLSIIQLGKQAKYDSAVARIDRKAKALFEQENNTIEALKFNYLENKELFTKAEQRLFETNLGDRERKLQADIDNRKEIDTLALQAQQDGAPTNIVQQMLAAKTKEEAIGLGGQFIGALDREAQRASIAASQANTAQGWANLDLRQQEVNISREKLKAELNTIGNQYGTLDGKPQNGTQALVNSYANRLLESESVITTVGELFTSKTSFGGLLPSIFQTPERQQFEQGKRNFINAVLRRESGAVIAETEFANADKQYFPQPGDSLEVLKQKENNRNTVINNFYSEANVPRPVFSGDIIEADGKRYRVESDGVTITEI